MRNFHDIFETCKQSFVSAFSISMAVPLSNKNFGSLIELPDVLGVLGFFTLISLANQNKKCWSSYCWLEMNW